MYDVLIIGAGVSGCAIARELSKYELKIGVLEKEGDLCEGTSKANSGIVHAGYDPEPGSLMAKLNIIGNQKIEELSTELDFEFERNGSLLLCLHEEDLEGLHQLYARGQKNGVNDLKLLSRNEVLELEPNVVQSVVAGLYAPTAGIVCPFGMTIALAENAAENGVEFFFNTKVLKINKSENNTWFLHTSNMIYETQYIVNAAGVYGDIFHNMVCKEKIEIIPKRGEYFLLDKKAGKHVNATIFQLPNQDGKGVLVTKTTHGNLLVGPTSIEIEEKEGTNVTFEGMVQIREKVENIVSNIPLNKVITSFAGVRAHTKNHDFYIKELEEHKGFIDCIGIESPGLTAAPAIGEMVRKLIETNTNLIEKNNYISKRKGILHPDKLSQKEYEELIRKDKTYANIICRCESITEGEIIDAINRPLGAKSLAGVKRRVRAGMGRCQGGFCSPKVTNIIERQKKL